MSSISTLDLLMPQARNKLSQGPARSLRPPNEDDVKLEDSLDRCNQLTEDMLAEARACLNEPAKQPALLTAAVATMEKRQGAGILVAKQTVSAAHASPQQAHGRAIASLKVQQRKGPVLAPSTATHNSVTNV